MRGEVAEDAHGGDGEDEGAAAEAAGEPQAGGQGTPPHPRHRGGAVLSALHRGRVLVCKQIRPGVTVEKSPTIKIKLIKNNSFRNIT